MKKSFAVLCCCLLLCNLSCVQEHASSNDNTLGDDGVPIEVATAIIEEMGFDVSDLMVVEDGYLVEGDILLTPQHVESFLNAPKTRIAQHMSGNVVSTDKLPYIRVECSSNDGVRFDPNTPCADAINYWNTYSQCNVILGNQGDAVITISCQSLGTSDQLMRVTYPSSSGDPGSIVINLDCEYLPSTSSKQAMYMMLHAFGHALGFAHDPFSAVDPGVGIPEVPVADPASIMNQETNPLSWTGFSEYDIWGFQALYPIPQEPEIPDPDFDTITWVQNESEYSILLTGDPFKVAKQINFPSQVNRVGSGWADFSGEEGMRIIDQKTDAILYEGEARSYTIEKAGSYILEYGAAVWQEDSESYICYYGTEPFTVTDPFMIEFPALDSGEELDLAKSYTFRYVYDDPAWSNCTASAVVRYLETGEEVALRQNSDCAWTILSLPGRGDYKITVTVDNGSSTRTKERNFTISPIQDLPLYYQLSWTPVNYDKELKYYVNFYGEEECTNPSETQYTVECHYILWLVYHDMFGVEQERHKQQEGTVRIPQGTQSYALPVLIPATDYHTLDGYDFEYEVECRYI